MRVVCVHQGPGSSLHALEPAVHARGHALEHWHPYRGDPPPDVDSAGAVIALGGVVHPDQDERHGWLAGEREVLRALVEADVPTLAICLGGQLLAQALGGSADRLEASEVGWFEVELSAAGHRDPLLGGFPPRFHAFEWHEYGFSVPSGARSLARSAAAPEQAFRFAEHAWGLQFHIEAAADAIALWTGEGRDALAAHGVSRDVVLADTARYEAGYARLADGLANRFLALAEARLAPRRATA